METEKVFVQDSRISTGAEVFKIPISGRQIIYQQVPFDTQTTYGSTIQINNFQVPNAENTCMSKKVNINYTLTVKCTTGVGVVLPQFNNDVTVNTILRQFPLMSVTDVANLGLNTSITSSQPRLMLGALARTMNLHLIKNLGCPSMPDYGLLVDQTNTAIFGSRTVAGRSLVNQPYSNYQQCIDDSTPSRASFLCTGVQVNQPAGFDTWTFTVSEPLLISPLCINDKEAFMYNINQFSLNLNISNYSDMVVSTLNPAVLLCSVSNANLEVGFITVDTNVIKIPKEVAFDYSVFTPFQQQVASTSVIALAGSDLSLTSQTIRLNALPDRIYIGVRRTLTSRNNNLQGAGGTRLLNDDVCLSFLGIDGNIQEQGRFLVQIGTKGSAFNNMSVQQLWEMSHRNGNNQSFHDWALGSGGYMCFSPTDDIGLDLPSDTVVGEPANINFRVQVKVSIVNLLASNVFGGAGTVAAMLEDLAANLEFIILPQYSGQAIVPARGACNYMIGSVTAEDVRKASTVPAIHEEGLGLNMTGSGLFSGKHANLVKKAVNKGVEFLGSDAGKKVLGHLAKWTS